MLVGTLFHVPAMLFNTINDFVNSYSQDLEDKALTADLVTEEANRRMIT